MELREGVNVKAMVIICVTVILATILVAWEWAQTPYLPFRTSPRTDHALQERFVVQRVSFDRENKGIIVYVRNVGGVEVSIVAIYINGTGYTGNAMNPQSPCAVSTQYRGQAVTMGGANSPSLCQFNLTWPTAWDGGSIFFIVVATARGNQATFIAETC